MSNKQSKNELDEHIVQLVTNTKPENVNDLIHQVKQSFPISEKEILARISYLQDKRKIRLEILRPQSSGLKDFLRSSESYWYWATVVTIAATILAVFFVPESLYPIMYVRYVLGAIFILWLPGYALVKALFLRELPVKTADGTLDSIERFALSIGLSLALVPMLGLVLNYTPWGITLMPVTLSLAALTASVATIAVIREYQARRKYS